MREELRSLVASCVYDIEDGQTGFFYVRNCCGILASGWNPVPIALPGIVWDCFSE